MPPQQLPYRHPYVPPSPKPPPTLTMSLTRRKTILGLVFVLITVSLLRVLRITMNSSYFPLVVSSPKLLVNTCNQQPSIVPLTPSSKPTCNTKLTAKELRFLSNVVLENSPCNLLVFGLEDQYLKLPIINRGGKTFFLEDRQEKMVKINGNRVFRVVYETYAKEAYGLLKYARTHSSCSLCSGKRRNGTKCKLALTGLPKEVYTTKWDVIVVDGPDGEGPESPGRMGAIFTAGVLARAGNGTNVVVHDVNRTIEKWFSWEFLCEENLVSSKGRFWNFRIGQRNKTLSKVFG